MTNPPDKKTRLPALARVERVELVQALRKDVLVQPPSVPPTLVAVDSYARPPLVSLLCGCVKKRPFDRSYQIIAKLREADAMLGTGATLGQVCQELAVSELTIGKLRYHPVRRTEDGAAQMNDIADSRNTAGRQQ